MRRIKLFTVFMALFIILGATKAYSQISVSPWKMHEGNEGVIEFRNEYNGDPRAYEKMTIPGKNDNGWKDAPKDANGNVYFDRSSTVRCLQQLDFTYFQTIVNIPANTTINEFRVSYDKADDGARIYFFNSKFPYGTCEPYADLIISKSRNNVGSVNLKDKIAPGENRVVIVQFDDCADRNSVHNIHISINGSEIKPVATKTATVALKNDPNGGVTIFEHTNFRGRKLTLGVGTYDITETEFNDIVSSIKVQEGYKVTLYRDWKTTGSKVGITADVNDLASLKFDEITSSLVIERISAPSSATALPDKFKVHAFSVNQGLNDKDDYWFALHPNNTRGVVKSSKGLVNGTKWMEIERVNLDNNTIAFKVLNAGADMYLVARNNKEVHVEKVTGNEIPDGAKFKTVVALTSAKGSQENNYRSFESIKFPAHFLRHQGFLLFVHPSNNTELFKQDASWLIQKM